MVGFLLHTGPPVHEDRCLWKPVCQGYLLQEMFAIIRSKDVLTAVGDGATAVSMVHRFLALKSRLSLRSATGTSPERCSGASGVRESRIAIHETQTRVVDELTNSDGLTFAKLI